MGEIVGPPFSLVLGHSLPFPFFISFMSPSRYNLKNTIDQESVLLYLFFSFKEAQRRFSFLLFRAAEQNGPG